MKRALFLIVVALAGCDKLMHKDTDTTASATATATAATATATATATVTATVTATATASAMATASAASGEWPAYLPDYPGAKVVKKSKDSESFETKDAPGKVIAFYKEKLTAAGFPAGAAGTLGKSDPNAPAVLTMSKGSVMVTISATPIQGTTKISISLI